MAALSNTALNLILDDLTRIHLRMIGTQASGYGLGKTGEAWGAGYVLASLINPDLLTAADLEPIVEIGASLLAAEDAFRPYTIVGSQLQGVFNALQTHLTGVGLTNVNTINDYLTYYNVGTGGTWQTLAHYTFKDLYDALFPQACLDPWNSYYEVLQGVVDPYVGLTYTNALRKHVVGSGNTAGQSIDGTKYSGGTPQLNVTAITGSGVVTVTGTAFDPLTKTTIVGATWTVTANATGRVAFTGGTAPANSHICAVSNIAAAAGITVGTMYVEAARPAGRALLP